MNKGCKKFFALLLAAEMVTSLAACSTTRQAPAAVSEEMSESVAAEPARTIMTESGSDSEKEADMATKDFSVFSNVEITGVDLSALNEEERSVLYQQAKYCQAMTEADTETMTEITSADMVFTHMNGRQQTREEYFADIADGSLQYFMIGIEKPMVEINGEYASVTYTSVLNAYAYGARGTYNIDGTHWYEKQDGSWVVCNAPEL